MQRFEEAISEVHITRARHVVNGDRITCSGAQAAFDLKVDQIGVHQGKALRLEVATLFMRAVAEMQANLEHPQTIADIARRVGYQAPSAFTRAFREEFERTPRQVRFQAE
mgnify:CR=1 FL=1